MSLALAGLVAGLAFACGLNLYLAVAVLGILFRLDAFATTPVGLQGLEGWVVIASAVALYLIEAVVDKVAHADSLWDAVHTFIRPPAAALLAIAALWGQTAEVMAVGAALALLIALATHGAKAGARMASNATLRTRGRTWISVAEDVLAATAAILALRFPEYTLAGVAAVLLLAAFFGPRFWGAFRLGNRSVTAWLRSIFVRSRWREVDELPRWARDLLDEPPLGAAPPRGTRATLHGLEDAGPFRNGWLVVTPDGPVFLHRTAFGTRRTPLPTPREIRHEAGVWAEILRVRADDDSEYTLYLLKDGPEIDLSIRYLNPAAVCASKSSVSSASA